MKLHLPTTLKAALIAAVLSAGSYPAWGVTSTTTEYTYAPVGGEEQTITFNGNIWKWNNNTNEGALSAFGNTYTNYSTNETVTGRDVNSNSFTNASFLYNFFNESENDRVGNTLKFSGATSNIRLHTDWTSHVWIGGLITEASGSNITYTLGRSGGSSFKLKGTGDVNLLLDSSFTLLTSTSGNASTVSVEKGGTWTVASGKTFTITAGQTTLATDQVINIKGGGTVNIGSALGIRSGSSINVAEGSTLTVSGATTNEGTITNNGNLTFNGALTLEHAIVNNDGASLAINGQVRLSDRLVIQQKDPITTRYSEGKNGFAQGQFVIASGSGSTTLGANATVVDSTGVGKGITTLADGSLATASDFTSHVYFVNEGSKTYAAASNLTASLYIEKGASAEVTGVLGANVNHVYGSGTLKVHLNDEARNFGLEKFSGTLHVEGSSTARGLLRTGDVVGENVTVELGTRGQILMTNGDTFANDIVIDSKVDTSVDHALKSRIYTNSNQSGTVTGNINLNGKALYKEGGGTLYIKGDKAVNSLLGGSNGSTLIVESGGDGFGGKVQIGENGYTSSSVNDYTTNLEVNKSTLTLSVSETATKTFAGTLTLKDRAVVELANGGSKFTGTISLNNNITFKVNGGYDGIELAGAVSGGDGVNAYLTSGNLNGSSQHQYQRIKVSGSNNTFSGTYFVGVDSNGSASATKVHLIAGAEGSLANASVNLSGGGKAVLSLAEASTTVAGLNGIAGSSIVTSATDGATLTVDGGGSYAGSFDNVNLTKKGAEATLTLTADTLTNEVSVKGGTLSLTAGTLTWGEGASVTVHSGNGAKLEMGANRGIKVTAHAPAVSTFAAGDANAATVTGSSISNADITLTSADDHISQTVSDSGIINNSGAKQTVQVGAGVAEVFANTGDIDLLTGDAGTLTATKVHIGSGRTVGVYQGTTDTLGDMASLELGDLVTDGTATLNAKVTSLDALTLGGVLTMGSGSSLALSGATIRLSDAFATSLATSLEGGAESVTLIEGIPGLSYEGAILNTGNLSGDYAYSLVTVTGDGGTESLVITAKLVPEPATATLSLLALAALAARRRRK